MAATPADTSIDALDLGVRLGRLAAGQDAIKDNLQQLREDTNDRFDKLEEKVTGLQKSVWMGAGGLGLMVLLMPVVMYFLPPRQTSLALLQQAPPVALAPTH